MILDLLAAAVDRYHLTLGFLMADFVQLSPILIRIPELALPRLPEPESLFS